MNLRPRLLLYRLILPSEISLMKYQNDIMKVYKNNFYRSFETTFRSKRSICCSRLLPARLSFIAWGIFVCGHSFGLPAGQILSRLNKIKGKRHTNYWRFVPFHGSEKNADLITRAWGGRKTKSAPGTQLHLPTTSSFIHTNMCVYL